MNTKDELFERYRNSSDDDIIEIIKHKSDYTEEAVEVATQMLNDRQIELPAPEPSTHKVHPEYKPLSTLAVTFYGLVFLIAPFWIFVVLVMGGSPYLKRLARRFLFIYVLIFAVMVLLGILKNIFS